MVDCWIILLDRVDDARCWSQLTDPRFLLAWVMDGRTRARRPLVVFKDTFRSRQYCLVECSDICNLLKDGEDDQ